MFSKLRPCKIWPTVVAKFNAHCLLSCRDYSTLGFFSSADPRWPWIKIKVIERAWSDMSCIGLPSCQVAMPQLNYCPRYYYYSTSKKCVKFQTQLWPRVNVQVIGLAFVIYALSQTIFTANVMGTACTASEIIEHLLLLSTLWSVWPWMILRSI